MGEYFLPRGRTDPKLKLVQRLSEYEEALHQVYLSKERMLTNWGTVRSAPALLGETMMAIALQAGLLQRLHELQAAATEVCEAVGWQK